MISRLSQLGLLLFVSALVAILTRRLRMPYTVGLVLAGMGLYFFHVRLQLHLSKDLIFSFLLPPLVFEAALYIKWRDFRGDLPVVALLATVGVVSPDYQNNHLLAQLSLEERNRLLLYLQHLYESGDRLRNVYFPADCIVSLCS